MTAPAWLPIAAPFIEQWEGLRLQAYICPAGIWTIGIGSTVMPDGRPVRRGDVLSADAARRLFRSQLLAFSSGLAGLLASWHSLTPSQQAALVSWAFNVGLGAVEGSTLRRRLQASEPPALVLRQELPRWNKGPDGPIEGLTRRRAAEVKLAATA